MSTAASVQIEEILSNVRAFRRTHPGIDYGEDFAPVAMELYKSKAFADAVKAQALIGTLGMLSIPKVENMSKDEQGRAFEKWLDESPSREPLAMMFYAGYKFARAMFEAEQMEREFAPKMLPKRKSGSDATNV